MNARELLEACLANMQSQYADKFDYQLMQEIEIYLAQPETKPKPITIDWPEYHYEGMGCGIEDRNITDRYDACRYGWDCALDAVAEILPEKLYAEPPKREPVYLSDDEIGRYISIPNPRNPVGDAMRLARSIEYAVIKANGIGTDND